MRKGRVSATHCCAFLDISATTFGRLIEDGVFARQSPSDGYGLKLVVRACCALWRHQAAGRADPEQDRVLSSARARHALAAAEERDKNKADAK
jgi:hypothetical protein